MSGIVITNPTKSAIDAMVRPEDRPKPEVSERLAVMRAPTLPPCVHVGVDYAKDGTASTTVYGVLAPDGRWYVFDDDLAAAIQYAAGLRATGAEPHENYLRWEAEHGK